MVVLYICSDDSTAGKTALALALARRLGREGLSVGYWKPLSTAGPRDEDAAFAGQALRLAEDVAALAPLALPDGTEGGASTASRDRLLSSLAAVAKGKDVLLVEGAGSLAAGGSLGLDARAVLDLVRDNAPGGIAPKALYLARYRDGDLVDRVVAAQQTLADAFAGVLINAVPEAHDWFIAARVQPALAGRGIPLFGVLPQDLALATVTIRELAQRLGAHVLVNEDAPAMDDLFESIMFGSMSAENGERYFSRKQNKLVVSRGDRPDVHLAALDTSTRCLLLTGGYPSYPFVLDKAEEVGVPVLSVPADMHATVERLDTLLDWARARDMVKIRRFEGLLTRHVDWPALYAAAGLEQRSAVEP